MHFCLSWRECTPSTSGRSFASLDSFLLSYSKRASSNKHLPTRPGTTDRREGRWSNFRICHDRFHSISSCLHFQLEPFRAWLTRLIRTPSVHQTRFLIIYLFTAKIFSFLSRLFSASFLSINHCYPLYCTLFSFALGSPTSIRFARLFRFRIESRKPPACLPHVVCQHCTIFFSTWNTHSLSWIYPSIPFPLHPFFLFFSYADTSPRVQC